MKWKAGRTRWKEQMEKRRAVRRGRGRRSGRKGGRSVVLLIVVRCLGVQERNRQSIKSLVLLPLLLPSFLSKYGTMSHSVIKSYLWLSSSRLVPFNWGLFYRTAKVTDWWIFEERYFGDASIFVFKKTVASEVSHKRVNRNVRESGTSLLVGDLVV